MMAELGTLGEGRTISLKSFPLPVNVGHPNGTDSGLMTGPVADSPIGPKVVVAVFGTLPGAAQGFSYMAHMSAAEALAVAATIMEAAATIAEAEQKGVQ